MRTYFQNKLKLSIKLAERLPAAARLAEDKALSVPRLQGRRHGMETEVIIAHGSYAD